MPHDPATLRSLAERCEAGEDSDRFATEIAIATGLIRPYFDDEDHFIEAFEFKKGYHGRTTVEITTRRRNAGAIIFDSPFFPLTESLDAQAALGVRIVHAEWSDFEGEFFAATEVYPGCPRGADSSAPTEPLARLAAILRALAAKAEADHA